MDASMHEDRWKHYRPVKTYTMAKATMCRYMQHTVNASVFACSDRFNIIFQRTIFLIPQMLLFYFGAQFFFVSCIVSYLVYEGDNAMHVIVYFSWKHMTFIQR